MAEEGSLHEALSGFQVCWRLGSCEGPVDQQGSLQTAGFPKSGGLGFRVQESFSEAPGKHLYQPMCPPPFLHEVGSSREGHAGFCPLAAVLEMLGTLKPKLSVWGQGFSREYRNTFHIETPYRLYSLIPCDPPVSTPAPELLHPKPQ